MMSKSARRVARNVRLAARSLSHEGTEFLRLWLRLRREVPGWLQATDARWHFACARDGPGAGVVVEIGSAWGKSTIVLARGSKSARRERVFTVDPHTGDDWFLAGCARPEAFDRLDPSQRPGAGAGFSSYGLFRKNLERFDVADWVVPIVSSSEAAAGIF